MVEENKRGSFGSNIGFLLSAIGSAVGLGNIWGFPYKMGKSGGFTFLLVYLALAVFVGFAIMLGELALGRKTGYGPVNAYKAITQKKGFRWIGWLAIVAPFLIMTFYSVLGGYCIYYIAINVVGLCTGTMPDSSSFGAMLTNPWLSIGIMVLFMVICFLINLGGVDGGIEKFNKIGMPALFVMLIIVIIRAWTLPHAAEGLKFMFVPGYAVKGGFIEEAPGVMSVLATAGGQMFFSLSLAMGAMITYGSYLDKGENLPKNSVIIVIADTIVAIMAGLAVIPAAVANGIAKGTPVNEIKLGGPSLLFATLQDVFHDMGAIGGIFG
ncbi:MAG: sodium-dependent transporter, partial [Oscillospiraceae bacterium]|nr:sodium-dependent transporter [Oscillospiraceae bacterium]